MSRSRISAGGCMLVLLLSQTACIALSENPLSDPDKAEVDERLFGQWKMVSKENDRDRTHAFFGRPRSEDIKNAPRGLMVIHTVGYSANHEVSANGVPSYFFVTKIGKDGYMNCIASGEMKSDTTRVWKQSHAKSYYFFKYTVTEAKLTLWMMDHKLAAKAVFAGKLKGVVKLRKDKDGKDTADIQRVTLTDTTENLTKFIEAANPPLFNAKEYLILERVKW